MRVSTDFGFLDPPKLWLLAAVVVVALLLLYGRALRARRLKALGRESRQPFWPFLASVFVLFLMALALARPYFGFEEVEISRQGRDIMVLVDVSKSMLTADLGSSRIDLAKRKLQDIIDYARSYSTGDRIGIVLFAGEAYLYCPLTSDYGVLKIFKDSISVDLISAQGTALNRAIAMAVESLKSVKSENAELILLSDGEDLSFDSAEARALISQVKLRVHALGIGSPNGSPIPLHDGSFLHDKYGQVVVSRLVEESLEKIANLGGGIYRQAAAGDSDIRSILGVPGFALDPKKQNVQRFTIYHEFGPLLLFLPLIYLFVLVLRKERGAVFALAIFLLPLSVHAQTPSLYDAYRAYEDGDYERARQGYEAALKESPNNQRIMQGLASSLYKLKKFDQAAALFEKLKKEGKSGRIRFNGAYNQGNSRFMLKDYGAAIKNYEEALKLKPKDNDTEHNLSLAKRLLEEQKKEEQKKEQDKEKNKDQTPSPTPSGQPTSAEQCNNPKEDKEKEDKEQKETKEQDKKKEDQAQSFEPTATAAPQEQSPRPEDMRGTPKQHENGQGAEPNPTPAAESSPEVRPQSGEITPAAQSTRSLEQSEAKAWLDSLPDTPLLLQRQTRPNRYEEDQAW